jgi:hypothetical protein
MAVAFGILLFGFGALVTFYNFFNSHLGYALHRWHGGSPEGYRASSVLAFFGSTFLWASIPFLYEYPILVWGALIISLFDTGGIHWMLGISLWVWWHDRK